MSKPDDICRRVARDIWANAHDGAECPIPTAADLGEWLYTALLQVHEFIKKEGNIGIRSLRSEPALIASISRLTALYGLPARWDLDAAHPERPTLVACAWKPTSLIAGWMMKDPTMYNNIEVYNNIEQVDAAWLALPAAQRPLHPLAPLVAAWQAEALAVAAQVEAADPASAKVQAVGGLTRVPYVVNELLRRQWAPVDEVTAIMVDGEPLTARIQDARPKNAVDWLYVDDPASAPDSDGNLLLPDRSFRYPQRARDMPLTMVALRSFDVDRRSSLKYDLRRIMTAVYASTKPLSWSNEEGARRVLARTCEGAPRTPKDSDVKRFRDATDAGGSIRLYYRDKYGETWLGVMVTDPYEGGRVLSQPAWFRQRASEQIGGGMGYTLTGAAHPNRQRRGTWSSYSLVINNMEYWLARSFEGEEGVAPLLRPVTTGGPGPWVTMKWFEALDLLGLYRWDRMIAKKNRRAREQYWRVVDGLQDAGYMKHGEAGNDDVVECQATPRSGKRSGRSTPWLSFRATARFCEAARLATAGKWQTVPLLDWLGVPE